MPLIWLLVGILIGLLVSRFIFNDKPIGSLRVDQSDPDSEPYLFLELDQGGMNDIYKKQSVRLRVKKLKITFRTNNTFYYERNY